MQQTNAQTWDASLYAGNGRFVALLAESLVKPLHPQAGERILDLGCGDGFLSHKIAESGATLVGVPPGVGVSSSLLDLQHVIAGPTQELFKGLLQ